MEAIEAIGRYVKGRPRVILMFGKKERASWMGRQTQIGRDAAEEPDPLVVDC